MKSEKEKGGSVGNVERPYVWPWIRSFLVVCSLGIRLVAPPSFSLRVVSCLPVIVCFLG